MWSLFRRNARQTKSTPRKLRSVRPRLEALEDRFLLTAGALDPTFGNGAGYVTTSLTNNNDYAGSAVTEPNGTIIVAGDTYTKTNGQISWGIGLAAYNPDGSLDTAFGNGGEVVSPGRDNSYVYPFLYPSTDPNGNAGKIIVSGAGPGFSIARYNTNGTLDTSFGQGGIATANFGSTLGTEGTFSAVIQPDGKTVALGQSADGSTAELARFKANGSLDTTFGTNGLATVAVPQALDLLLQPDGSLVVVGWAHLSPQGSGLGMAELTANGALNTSFGNGGMVTNSSFGGGGGTPTAGALGAIDPTGKTSNDQIVVIGTNPSSGWELARYNPDGTLDSTFGNGGLVQTSSQLTSIGIAVVVQPDGKIVATGRANNSNYPGAIGLARYNPDGSLDGTFGTGGFVTTKIGTRSSLFQGAGGVSLQPNGDILVASSSYNGSKWNFALARYLPTATSEPLTSQIGTFTANPNPVTAGSPFTLTASGLTDSNPGSTITQVIFYHDSDKDSGTLNTSTDKIIGFATQTSPGVRQLSASFGLKGTYKLFAQADDNFGVYSDPIALMLTVQ